MKPGDPSRLPGRALRGRARAAEPIRLPSIAPKKEAGADQIARPSLTRRAGRRRHFSPCAVYLLSAGNRSRSRVPSWFLFLCPPRFGRVSCQRMIRAALVLWNPARCAAFFTPLSFVPVPFPWDQNAALVPPPFRRRVSHAGRERRLIMNEGNACERKWAQADANIIIE